MHKVVVKGEKVYISLNLDAKELESDQYARPLTDKDEGPTLRLGPGVGKGKGKLKVTYGP